MYDWYLNFALVVPSNPAYFSTYTAEFIIATLPTAGFIIRGPAYGRRVVFFFSPDRLCNVPQGVVLRPIWDVGTSLAGTLLNDWASEIILKVFMWLLLGHVHIMITFNRVWKSLDVSLKFSTRFCDVYTNLFGWFLCSSWCYFWKILLFLRRKKCTR